MPTNQVFQGVPNCYVFKSQLQEYAQKVGLPTPVYETIKEGPSHEPSFRSTVIVNDVRYDSLPGFFTRKAAEQSAAEVALVDLSKSDQLNQSITLAVHETGLCKNLLQEYAQKMNYAMPMYQCSKVEKAGRASVFSCTVDIGGFRYIGGVAKTKKEADIKAARTALLAIQSSASHSSENQFDHSKLTVIPCRKRATESVALADETANSPKPKKARLRRKASKRKPSEGKMNHIHAENLGHGANTDHEAESHSNVNESGVQEMKSNASVNESSVQEMKSNASVTESGVQEMKSRPFTSEAMNNFENGIPVTYLEKETLTGEGSLAPVSQGIFENGKLNSEESNLGTVAGQVSSVSNVDVPEMSMEMNSQQCNERSP